MLLTLNLIVVNIYNSVQAPKKRPFGTLELWWIGVLIPILTGTFEYGFLLGWKKYSKPRKVHLKNGMEQKKSCEIDQFSLKVDKWTGITVAIFFAIFNLVFWNYATAYRKKQS